MAVGHIQRISLEILKLHLPILPAEIMQGVDIDFDVMWASRKPARLCIRDSSGKEYVLAVPQKLIEGLTPGKVSEIQHTSVLWASESYEAHLCLGHYDKDCNDCQHCGIDLLCETRTPIRAKRIYNRTEFAEQLLKAGMYKSGDILMIMCKRFRGLSRKAAQRACLRATDHLKKAGYTLKMTYPVVAWVVKDDCITGNNNRTD